MKVVKITESTAQVKNGILDNHEFKNEVDKRIITGYKKYELGGVPAELGLGGRYAIPVSLVEDDTYVVEVFSEYCLPPAPSNPEIGYTDEDLIVTSGVQEQVYLEYGDRGVSLGEIMSVEEFIRKHDLSSVSEVILSRLLDDVEEHCEIPDDLLESYSAQWHNRRIGENVLFEDFNQC